MGALISGEFRWASEETRVPLQRNNCNSVDTVNCRGRRLLTADWPGLCSPTAGEGPSAQFPGNNAMPEDRKTKQVSPEEIIAAFDRETAEARELRRKHREQVRASRENDRPVRNERPPRK
jgi:hypothetical protein